MRAAAERRAGRDLDRRRPSLACVCGRAGELNIVAKLMPPIRVINARRSRTFFARISRVEQSIARASCCLRYRGRTRAACLRNTTRTARLPLNSFQFN